MCGRDDVSKSHVVWRSRLGSDIPSPIYKDGYIYWVSDRGQAICVNAADGKQVYQERLSGARGMYASAVVGGDNLFAVMRNGTTFVIAAKPEFKQVAKNSFEGDSGDFNATPAFAAAKLLIRSDSYLYGLGK